jgi:hypothetical protein
LLILSTVIVKDIYIAPVGEVILSFVEQKCGLDDL